MTLSTLDPRTALIIIDLQKGIVSLPLVHPVSEVVMKAGALAEAFRSHGLPAVLVNVAGRAPGRTEQPRGGGEFPAGWTDLIRELNQPADGSHDHEANPRGIHEDGSRRASSSRGGHAGCARGHLDQQWRRVHRTPGL